VHEPQAFWDKVAITDEDDDRCWEWQASKNEKGYGQFRGHVASRLAYRLTHGPIPDGHYVCHHCDNPGCCRPSHLFAGTPKDNWDDCVNKGRAHTLPPRQPKEIPQLLVEQIVNLANANLTNRQIVTETGLTYSAVASRVRKLREAGVITTKPRTRWDGIVVNRHLASD
jgi:hypothetical protein